MFSRINFLRWGHFAIIIIIIITCFSLWSSLSSVGENLGKKNSIHKRNRRYAVFLWFIPYFTSSWSCLRLLRVFVVILLWEFVNLLIFYWCVLQDFFSKPVPYVMTHTRIFHAWRVLDSFYASFHMTLTFQNDVSTCF